MREKFAERLQSDSADSHGKRHPHCGAKSVQNEIAQDERLHFEDVAKLVGCINALEKRRDNVSQVLAEI